MPHDIILSIAIVWIAILFAVSLIFVIARSAPSSRILAFDLVTMMVIGILVLLSLKRQSAFDLDAALMLGLMSFGGTLAATRILRERKIFS